YKRGERNVFTRKLYTMQGQKAFEEIRKRYRGDGDFKRTVDRYIGEFERLLEEVSRDDRGQMVARTYLTSETGRGYTMLAHAAGRFDASDDGPLSQTSVLKAELELKTDRQYLPDQLRLPILDERANLYSRAVHAKSSFANEEYTDARDRILDAMAAEIAGNLPESAISDPVVASPVASTKDAIEHLFQPLEPVEDAIERRFQSHGLA